jgi:outer membrane immunogenic protein
MPVKAPYAPAPATVYNWTGWYAGVNAGASFGSVKTDFNVAPVLFLGLPGSTPAPVTPGLAGSDREHPDGFIGGARLATIGSILL